MRAIRAGGRRARRDEVRCQKETRANVMRYCAQRRDAQAMHVALAYAKI